MFITIHVYYANTSSHKSRAKAEVILMWLYIQIGILFVHILFFKLLNIQRLSPSLTLTHFTRLSEISGSGVKDASRSSFPSGHGFAMFYWVLFSRKFLPKKLLILTSALAVFFCIPRIMSGAHWASDVVFAGMMSYLHVTIMMSTPMYNILINFITNRINKLTKVFRELKHKYYNTHI